MAISEQVNNVQFPISVIIPTFNGKYKISHLLSALFVQTIKEFEIIIVIDGSTDGTEEFLKNLKVDFSISVQVQINKGRAAVRNAGARLATGRLLLFFDDDMRPSPDCIAQHLKHHQQNPQSLMSGAQIDDDRLADTPFKSYKCFLSKNWARHLVGKEDEPLGFEELHLTAANFSIEKDLFEKLGGFDECLKDAEDFDLAVRAFKQGYPVYYNHKAFAWHDDFPSCRSFINRQRQYQEYHNYLLERKPEVYHDVIKFKHAIKLNKVKRLFYSIWKHNWLVNLADKSYFGFLPKLVQFKLYDWIVAAHVLLKGKES